MSLKDLREAETKQAGADAIDAMAEVVAAHFPKGTTDPLGRALRHQLHKLGRLNDPVPVAPVLKDQANAIWFAATVTPEDFKSGIFDAAEIRGWQVKLAKNLEEVLWTKTASGLFEGRREAMGNDAYRNSIRAPKA